MSMRFGDVIATYEQLANGADGAPETELEAQETETEVAETAGEMDTDEAEVAKVDSVVADAEASEDTIGELTEMAEDSLAGEDENVPEGEVGEEGEGLTEGEAAVIEITHEAIMAKLGIERPSYTKLTAESFHRGANRRRLTMEALDGLKDSAKKIGAGIVAALKAALNAVLNFLNNFIRNRALMQKHLVNLQEQLKTIEGKSKQKDTLTAGAAALSIDGEASVQTAVSLMDQAAKLVDISKITAEALGQVGLDMSKVHSGEFKLSYGRTMVITTEEAGIKFDVKEGKKAESIPAPDVAGIRVILMKAVALLTRLSEFEKTQSKLKSAVQGIIDRVTRYVDKGIAAVKKDGGTEEEKKARAAKEDARIARATMSKIGSTIPAAVFQVIKGAADYAKAGIGNYGEGSVKEAPKAAAAPEETK